MDADDELDAARRRFPVGTTVTGRVVKVPKPGAIGVIVDLGGPPEGFVDVLLLPWETEDWPTVGAVATFEVIQHRRGQARLHPLGGAIPPPPPHRWRLTDQEWSTRKARHPIGSELTATVTDVFPNNREYAVDIDGVSALAEWRADEHTPTVGDSRRYRLVRHTDRTQLLVVAPADPSGPSIMPSAR